jgi:uncharacterized OB-fold protein
MSNCSRCGVPFHPEITKCPVCGELREREKARRNKLWFLVNTLAVSFVAMVVLVRTLSAGEIQIGMSSADCEIAKDLVVQTRSVVTQLESTASAPEALAVISLSWGNLAEHYTPGKYSWSSSGLEHNWLQRLAVSSAGLASGEQIATEGQDDPAKYVIELTRLLPRYCS